MGACTFREEAYGESAKKVYDLLCSEAEEEYGDDCYNGTISTTYFCKISKSFDKPTLTNEKKANKFIREHLEKIDKRDCYCVDLGIDHYEIVTVKKQSPKVSSPKFKKKYVVHYSTEGFRSNKEKTKSFDSKKEAENFTMKEQLSNPEDSIFVTTEYVVVKGNNTISTMKVEITTKKTMSKSLKQMPNRIVKPIHKYIFYGWAAE